MISVTSSAYRGRLAPTPSGPLHLGSLLTALASYLQSHRQAGTWLLRIDDLDRQRCLPGMADRILRQLEAHGLRWDEAPRYQSAHVGEYRAALEQLRLQGGLYSCACTRAELKAHARPGPGTVCLEDGGGQCRERDQEVGDIALRRTDGPIAYQLACVVDERAQRISEVVRGVDLLGSTFQQRCVQDALHLAPPAYRHLPVLVEPRGRKLSKQNHAAPLEDGATASNLRRCLSLLNQAAPPHDCDDPESVMCWAVAQWDAAKVPRTAQIAGGITYNALQQSSA